MDAHITMVCRICGSGRHSKSHHNAGCKFHFIQHISCSLILIGMGLPLFSPFVWFCFPAHGQNNQKVYITV